MTEPSALLDAMPDKDELRRSAPLAAVAHALGVRLDASGRGLCPFHEADGGHHTPSFNLWVDPAGIQRWGCFPCSRSGDAFDLVQQLETCSFGAAVRRVAAIAAEAPAAPPTPRAELDRAGLEAYVAHAQARASARESRGLVCVAASLCDQALPEHERLHWDTDLMSLGWGVDDRANVVVPHYGRDHRITGAKIRAFDGQKWSFPGSEFTNLYGCWVRTPRGVGGCLVTEGETDYAHALRARPPLALRALPAGASARTRDEWLADTREFDDLYLAFDGDEPGWAAEEAWAGAHRPALTGGSGPRVWTCRVPDGHDLRSCGVPLAELVANAQRLY